MTLQRMHAKLRFRRKGAVSVEMALVMPILLVVMFGIIEFGQLFFVRLTLGNAAREGARVATLMLGDADKAALVWERTEAALLAGGLGGYNYTITHVSAPPPGVAETVSVSLPFSEVSLLGNFFSITDVTLNGTCSMSRDSVGG